MTMMQHALAWAERGFRVFPVTAGANKPPLIDDWQQKATDDPLAIFEWWDQNPEANVGVHCKDLVVVDIDNKNGKQGSLAWGEEGLPSDTLTVRTPTGGYHLYYRHEGDLAQRPFVKGCVDTRTARGYVMAPGSVRPDGAYELIDDAPVLPAPDLLVSRCGAPRERKEAERNVDLDTDFALSEATLYLVERAPESIEGQNGNDTTYKVACRLRQFGVSEDVALELLQDHYNDVKCYPAWHDDELTGIVANAFAYATAPAGADTPEFQFDGVDIPAPERKPRTRGKFIWAGDPVDLNHKWLVYNRIPQVGTGALIGPSNSGKTFVALKLAECLATGEEFFGVTPDEQVGTIILAAEGVAGLGARMTALRPGPIVAVPVSLLGDGEKAKGVVEDIEEAAAEMKRRGVRLGMIVVDTLAASGLLLDENNNTECAKAVKALEALAARFQCFVLATHHPPKNGTGARGGSALHAGFDTVFEVFRQGEAAVRYVKCTKGRDAPTGEWGSFTLIPRTVGMDAKFREVTTCEVSMGNERPSIEVKEPPHFDTFLACFDTVRVEAKPKIGKDEPIPRSELRKTFGVLSNLPKWTASRAFEKCLNWAETSFQITVETIGDLALVNDRRPEIADEPSGGMV